jgi:gliding motility-associated lipoprotein GldH
LKIIFNQKASLPQHNLKRILSLSFFTFYFLLFTLVSCSSIDLYEKTAITPGLKWESKFKPSFTFTIKDTNAFYSVFLVFRHNEKYNYNNLFFNLSYRAPGDSLRTQRFEERLADNEKGFQLNAVAMDDIYEHRIDITKKLTGQDAARFTKPGNYTFTLEHIMREDPLMNVMNVGLRVEKKQ